MRPECGNKNCLQFAFEQARAAAQAAQPQAFADLYIVADHLFWGTTTDYQKLQTIGAKAVTAFVPVADNQGVPQGSAERPVRRWADEIAALYGAARTPLAQRGVIDVMPGIFVQFDDTGFGNNEVCDNDSRERSQKYHLLDGTDWQHMVATAGMGQRWLAKRTTILPNCSEIETSNTDTSIVWIYSFNEWGEGSGLEPLQSRNPPFPFGFGSHILQLAQGGLGATGASTLPSEPVQRFPEGTTEGLRPPFSWDAVQFGDQYNIRIKNAANQQIVDAYTNNPNHTPDFDLDAQQPYTWRVRGHNNVGWGEFSPNLEFTPTPACIAAPPAPQVMGPVGCVNSVRPTFSWTASTCASDYQIVVSRDNPEEHLVHEIIQGTSYTITQDLLPGVLYRWRVKANNSLGFNWSPLTYFTPICGPSIAVGDLSINEGNAGTVQGLVPVSLSAASGTPITVSYATANGSATTPSDYESVSGTLTFEPGTTTRSIAVRAVGDVLDEPSESFAVNLSNAAGGGIGDGQGQISIVDDDSPWKVAAVADYNSDGWGDLLWQHQTEGWLVVWLMNGTVRTQSVLPQPNRAAADFANWKVVASPDLNGDGDADFLWQHQPTGSLVVWLMEGLTRVSTQVPQPAAPASDGANWRVAGVVDLNGDPYPDLLWQHRPTGSLVVWHMNGLVRTATAVPSPAAPASDGANWEVVAIDDFNQDQFPDFVWQHRATSQLVVWHMKWLNRTDVSSPSPSGPASEPGNWRVAAAREFSPFNGFDLYPDLLWQHKGPGSLVVWFMEGVVRAGTAIPQPSGPAE